MKHKGTPPGEDHERCGCYTPDMAKELQTHLHVYDNCDPGSSLCKIPPKSK